MNHTYLVFCSNTTALDELRLRLTPQHDIVPCASLEELRQRLAVNPNRSVVAAPTETPTHVNGHGVHHQPTANGVDVDSMVNRDGSAARTLADRVDIFEQKVIESSLQRNGNRRKDTAAELGISRVTLYNKMKKFGLLA